MQLNITHDRLRNKEFPADKLRELGLAVSVSNVKFEQHVTIEIPELGEDPLRLIYELGQLVHSLTVRGN